MNWDNTLVFLLVSCLVLGLGFAAFLPGLLARESTSVETVDHVSESSETPAIQKPILAVIRWFHARSGNYGLSIILTTLLSRLLLLPLTRWSFLAQKRMQAIQPRMAELKTKYKDDPKQLTQALAQFLKDEEVNPLGPLFTMIPQLPLLFAMNAVFNAAAEFRGSPFYGWIKDLSVKDPLHILPILFGISLFLQQRFAGPTPQVNQAMLMIIPIVSTMFMMTLPAGLLIYSLSGMAFSVVERKAFQVIYR